MEVCNPFLAALVPLPAFVHVQSYCILHTSFLLHLIIPQVAIPPGFDYIPLVKPTGPPAKVCVCVCNDCNSTTVTMSHLC